MEHVSREEALHIVAYMKSLSSRKSSNGNEPPIKSPKGQSAHQVWDGSSPLTKEQIKAWDFWKINVSFEFPRWIEGDNTNTRPEDNTDWLSEIGLPNEKPEIKIAFDSYLKNPNYDNLYRIVRASKTVLSEGERNPGEHGYRDFKTSFDYQRWLATLYMQHIRKEGITFGESTYDSPEFSMLDPIWDVGNVARRSQDNGRVGEEIPNRLDNEVKWLYLAWLGNMGKRNSFETQYIGTALKDKGERDLASLVILRSMLHRSPNSQRLFDDIFSMTYITSTNMLYRSLQFGLNEILDRLRSNYTNTRLSREEATIILNLYEGEVKRNINNSAMTSQEKNEIIASLDSIIIRLREMR
jgi:hypothetical protein